MPDLFQGRGTLGWNFLLEFPKHWPWLVELFGDRTDFHIGLCAYYLGLNVLELADCVASGNEKILTNDRIDFDVPLFIY